ncbi:MAG: RluA family pseudouridine synthase [Candidatus Saccharimonadales bacterium]
MSVAIIYQNDDLLVVNKPAGMLVHPGNGTPDSEPTVMSELAELIDDPGSERPGIVHRLDKDTSGVMVVARTAATRDYLQAQFKQRQVTKVYLAAVHGHLKHPQARLEWPLGRHYKNPMKRTVRPDGRMAVSEYQVVEELPGYSLLRVMIMTGRTHQIRAHLQHLGHPVVGDRLYGSSETLLARQFLHSLELTFTIAQNGEKRTFMADLSRDLQQFWYNKAQDATTSTSQNR